LIIIDIGQSGARAKIDGEIIELTRGKSAGEPILQTLRDVASLLPKTSADIAALSLTGLFGHVEDPTPYQELSRSLWGTSATVVIDDGLASYFGAVGGENGVALTLGGGVVAVGGRDGKFSHADGLGSTFGDEGSGYWLGTRGLTRALATRDGRDNKRDLALFLQSSIEAFDELAVKNSSDAVIVAIKSARLVLEAADAGIDAAIQIRSEAAFRLSQSIIAAWIKAGGSLDEAPVIATSGGLSQNRGYVDAIMDALHRQMPNAIQIFPRGNNIDGAEWIATHLFEDMPPLMKWAKG
jgi:glucosamine kinase